MNNCEAYIMIHFMYAPKQGFITKPILSVIILQVHVREDYLFTVAIINDVQYFNVRE